MVPLYGICLPIVSIRLFGKAELEHTFIVVLIIEIVHVVLYQQYYTTVRKLKIRLNVK